MKSKFLLGLFLLTPSIVFSAHTSNRKLFATDIVNKSGTSVFRFPTSLPTANRVPIFNTDQQLTSSSVTETELGFVSTATDANTASTIVKRDADSRVVLNQAIGVITSVASAAGTTTLTKSSSHTLVITGTSTQTVVLPNATTLVAGETYLVKNQSTGIATIQDGGANTLLSMTGKSSAIFTVTSIATTAGTWDITKDPINYGGVAAINGTTTLTAASPRNIAITGTSLGSATVRLPAGNALAVGDTFKITNYFSDANLLTLANNSGTTLLFMPPKTTYEFTSLDNTSAGGTWLVKNLGSGSSTFQLGLIPRISSTGTTEFKSFGQPLSLANSTATYTMTTADAFADYIFSTNTSATGAKQLTLLANNDRLIWVVCGSTGRLNIAVTAGGTINGSTTWSLTQQGQAVLLQNEAGNYRVIATQGDPLENITASTLTPAIYSSGFTLDSSSNNITVTLPSAAESSFMKGKKFFFKRTSSGTNTITFNTTSSQTISGYASGVLTLLAQGDYFEFESDGANWVITVDGRSPTVQNVATNTTLSALNKEMIITCDATSGNVTTTGYALSGRTGWRVTLKKVDASGNSCIYTAASGSGDGASVTLTTQNSGKTMAISGTNTYIVESF